MARVVIIGAGLTGLSAAYHLEQKGFHDYIILEKNNTVGGLCGSVMQDGFTFDYTGHLLHINDAYFRSFIIKLVGLDFFNHIQRRSYVYSHNRYTHYPYQINLHGLPHTVIVDCIQGFVERPQYKKKRSFKDWVLANFGSGFAKHFFTPYQEKIFSYPIDKITASWTSRFVPSTTLNDILNGTLQEPQESIGYNAQFYYPKKGGIVSWVHKVKDALSNPIATDCTVTHIDTNKKIVYTNDGQQEQYAYIINTIPLDTFLNLITEKPTMDCKRASKKLKCNSVFNFNLGINKPSISDKHWIYYPEKKYPFYRVGFPHNLSKQMTPHGCSSLYGEIAFINKSRAALFDDYRKAHAQIKQQIGFTNADIITEKLITISHAYVIFDFWREKNLQPLLNRLEQEQIYSIGRYGAWKYASMQESVLDGKKIADTITIQPAQRWYHIPAADQPKQKEC